MNTDSSPLTAFVHQGPYRDPKTGLRYHDLGVYNYIQNLVRYNAVLSLSLSPDHFFSESCYYPGAFIHPILRRCRYQVKNASSLSKSLEYA